MGSFAEEIKSGQRYEFGKNWKSFLSTLSEERIREAEKSLQDLLQRNNLEGKTVLDIGSGSGLFSLSARRLGAIVRSFDYDPDSVECTKILRNKFFDNDTQWTIENGSILDQNYIKTLGQYDIVYSWGVLHHTGKIWEALENASKLVRPEGLLVLAIYNDAGLASKFWKIVKKFYCSNSMNRILATAIFIPYFFIKSLTASIVKRENLFSNYKKRRGMSIVHNWFDWLGGYPYEFAKVEDIFKFYIDRGFVLTNIKTCLGTGNNQFVFLKKG